jgi:hypothetical protein
VNEALEQVNEDPGAPSLLPGVPSEVAQEFLRGLDDVRNGRIVDTDTVIAEGRWMITQYREKKRQFRPQTAKIPVVSGVISGVPIEEMEAWEEAQNKGIDLPEPKARRIE